MSLRREFENWMDKEYPLWRDPKNLGGPHEQRSWRAFQAGFKIGDNGPTVKGLKDKGGSISIFDAAVTPKRKFKEPT